MPNLKEEEEEEEEKEEGEILLLYLYIFFERCKIHQIFIVRKHNNVFLTLFMGNNVHC